MVIYGVFIVSKSGGLIYNYDHNIPKVETEKTFGFPLDIKLQYENKKVVVAFGQRDGINGNNCIKHNPLKSYKNLGIYYLGIFPYTSLKMEQINIPIALMLQAPTRPVFFPI